MQLADMAGLSARERAAALHAWFVQRLDDAGLHHSPVGDLTNPFFVQDGTTYLFRALWPDRPVDRADINLLAPPDAPATMVLLSMSDFTDDARDALLGRKGTTCVLLDSADANRIEATGIPTPIAAGAEVGAARAAHRLRHRIAEEWRNDLKFRVSVSLAIVGIAFTVLFGKPAWLPGHQGETKPSPSLGPAILDPSIDVELHPPVDHVDFVEVTWTAPDGYNYIVEFWQAGSLKAEREESRTKRTVSIHVERGSLYCFRVMAISPLGHYNISGVEPIRGASCLYPPSPAEATP